MSIIGKEIKVLDKGFVRVIDTMGSDAAIVQAARVSYGDGTKTVSEDHQLIGYLTRHHHTSPSEMCEIKLHCKMPIFVARQWVRHRMASLNEYSGRYSIMKDEFYIPELDQVRAQSNKNKQVGEGKVDDVDAEWFKEQLEKRCQEDYQFYKECLDRGIAKEMSRIKLPLNLYTEWYWKIDLNNLMKFLFLRMDSHAQYEIRVYADAIGELIKEWLPFLWDAFEQYKYHAITFSLKELKELRYLIDKDFLVFQNGQKPEEFTTGEWREFNDKLAKIKTLSKR